MRLYSEKWEQLTVFDVKVVASVFSYAQLFNIVILVSVYPVAYLF